MTTLLIFPKTEEQLDYFFFNEINGEKKRKPKVYLPAFLEGLNFKDFSFLEVNLMFNLHKTAISSTFAWVEIQKFRFL